MKKKIQYRFVLLLLLTVAIAHVNSCQKSDPEPIDKITLPTLNVNFDIGGGVQRIKYTATSELRVGATPQWLKVYTEQQSDQTTLVIESEPIDVPVKRTAIVEVVAGDTRASFTVSQQSDPNGRPRQVLDSMALVAIYNSCNGAHWQIPVGDVAWDLDKPFRSWSGVHSDLVDGQWRVYSLSLSSYGLTGQLPEQMAYLTHMSNLLLEGNLLEGAPFTALSKLSKLQLLNLSLNLMSDHIDADISAMKGLVLLDLSLNQFEGELPENISQLPKLEYLYMSGNMFKGSVPAKYIQLTNLKELNLAGNQLSGELPSVLCNMLAMTELNLSSNNFSGTIPEQISNLARMQELDLSTNNFSGQIPAALGAMLELGLLNLANNTLSGSVPDRLGEIQALKVLNIGSNNLTAIHSTIGSNTQLEYLDLSLNSIATLAESLSDLVNLNTLFINNNKIVKIPDMSRLVKLSELYADHNLLAAIPAGIEKCVNMREIIMRHNKITLIPTTLQNMSWLEKLNLSDNQIRFTLPEWFGKMPKLRMLHLANNNMIGTIPEKILNAGSLTSLIVSGNNMGGVLPEKILNDVRWKGETITVISEAPPYLPVTVKHPGLWLPERNICPQNGVGFTNCGFTHTPSDQSGWASN